MASLAERFLGSETVELVREFLFPSSVTRRAIPPLDGGLGPNDRLEQCRETIDVPEPDDLLVGRDGCLRVASGRMILEIGGASVARVLAELPAEVTALADAGDGSLYAGVAGQGIVRIDEHGQHEPAVSSAGGVPLRCVTAIAVGADGTLFATDGSSTRLVNEWVWDLMENGATGRLVRAALGARETEVVLSGLAWPAGVALAADGRSLALAQAWHHRIDRVDLSSRKTTALAPNLPGYPGRLANAPDGGLWVALFAMRTHLVEFVLRQREFKEEMMRTIHPDFWIRPALSTIDSGLIPLQGGGIRKLGITKPWAPPRSYGLVCRLDDAGMPLESFHSRPGGRHHGVTAVAESGEDLWVACKGGNRLLRLREAVR